MFYVVLDFEATCQANYRIRPQEIIEFPSVVLDGSTLEEVGRIQLYVRPIAHPRLSEFCTGLTGIQQQTVDAARTFPEVFEEYDAWVRQWPDAIFVTCGDWDLKTMLPAQCWLSGLHQPDRYHRWLNIKREFEEFYKREARGLAGMVQALGMRFEGRPHSGLDDSINTARVWARMIRDGYRYAPDDGSHDLGNRRGGHVKWQPQPEREPAAVEGDPPGPGRGLELAQVVSPVHRKKLERAEWVTVEPKRRGRRKRADKLVVEGGGDPADGEGGADRADSGPWPPPRP